MRKLLFLHENTLSDQMKYRSFSYIIEYFRMSKLESDALCLIIELKNRIYDIKK